MQLVERAVVHDPAVIDDDQATAQALDVGEIVRGEDERRVARLAEARRGRRAPPACSRCRARPLKHRIGPTLFRSVIVFGAATAVFGLSTNFALSLVALSVLGAADVVSMVIRSALAQIRTPDAMRGRVSAVSSLFTGTSNQLGAFESGVATALLGAVPAVLLGGVGAVASRWPRSGWRSSRSCAASARSNIYRTRGFDNPRVHRQC